MGHINPGELMRQDHHPEHGNGFTVYDVHLHRGDRELITYDHGKLLHQIAVGLNYAKHHHGDLPDTPFWDRTVDIWHEDKALFSSTHQCDMLLHLLRVNDRHDRLFPETPPIIPPVGPITGPTTPGIPLPPGPVVGGEEPPPTHAVPEPASIISMGIGLIGSYVVARRRRRLRKIATTH